MSEEARPNARAAVARALLLEIEADRPKRIDQYLDYFGSGGESGRTDRVRDGRHAVSMDQGPLGSGDGVS